MKRIATNNPDAPEALALSYDLGSFQGFDPRTNQPLKGVLTAEEMVNWDSATLGDARFCPCGNHPGVSLVFRGRSDVSPLEVLALDRLLNGLTEDGSILSFLRIHYAINIKGIPLEKLTSDEVEGQSIYIGVGTSPYEVRREVALEMFDKYSDDWRVMYVELCNGTHALIVED